MGIYRLGEFACISSFGGGTSEIMPSNSIYTPVLSVKNASATAITFTWKNPSLPHSLPASNKVFLLIFQVAKTIGTFYAVQENSRVEQETYLH